MFKSIRSLAVYVSDIERAKKFYTDILGFVVSSEPVPNLCFLESKSGRIHIYLEGGCKPSPIDRETSRLSFFLEAEKSASETYKALKAADVKLVQGTPEQVGDDTYSFQFEDPDGNIIEVTGRP